MWSVSQCALPATTLLGRKPALEPSPSDSLCVEQIANVLVGIQHGHRVAGGAVVIERLRITDNASTYGLNAREGFHNNAMRLSGNQVQCAGSGRSKRGVVSVVAHGEVFRLIPQRRDRIPVKLAHDLRWRAARARAGMLGKFVHQSGVEGLLFIGV